MTIRVVCIDPETGDLEQGGLELVTAWQGRRDRPDGSRIWIDLCDLEPVEERALMCDRLGLHPNAVMDAQRDRHPPKAEQFAGYLFLLLRGLDPESSRSDLRTVQLAVFVGEDFLVTRHSGPSASVEGAWREISADPPARLDTLRLALRIARLMTDRYLSLLFDLESRLDEIEDEMLTRPQDALLTELSDYKRELTRLRRNFTYHNQAFVSARTLLADRLRADGLVHDFNDVAEQVDRVGSLAELYYDLASDLLQTYVSLASHRLNGIMKILTIVTAIFVPLSFLAGLYGMNFEYMPELGQRYGYFMLLGVMAAIAAVLLYVFRRRQWL